jgi:hypothetical protein
MVWPVPKPAVKTAIAVLRAALDPSVGVATVKPRIWPRLFVMVTRAGGGQTLPNTDVARILVECWADSDAACEALTNECRAALRNTQGVTVDGTGVFLRGFDNENGPVQLPDPDVPDHRRWQFQGDLLVSTN